VTPSPYRFSPLQPLDALDLLAHDWGEAGQRRSRLRRRAPVVAAVFAPVAVLALAVAMFCLRGSPPVVPVTSFYRVDIEPLFDGFNGVVQCHCLGEEQPPWLLQNGFYEFVPPISPRDVGYAPQLVMSLDSPPGCASSCAPIDSSMRAWLRSNRTAAARH
jgi:hypothetical protein